MFCEFDIFKEKEPIHEVFRKVNNSDIIAYNGIREIYVNLKAIVEDNRLNNLFKIITTEDYKNENIFPELSKKKNEIINLMVGGTNMSGLTLEIFKDGEKKGIEKGMKKGIEKGMEKGMEKILDKLVREGIITKEEAEKQLVSIR